MKFRADRDSFAAALGLSEKVARAAGSVKPIYACVHIVASINGVTVAANDNEIKVRNKVIGDVEQPGEAAVPAKRMLEILRECEGESIDVETDGEAVVIRDVPKAGKGSRFKLNGFNPVDFYAFGHRVDPDEVFAGADIATAIDSTAFCASKEITRYAINGVLMSAPIVGHGVTFVATDGKRLAKFHFDAKVKSALSAVIPLRAIQLIRKIIGDNSPCNVGVRVTPNEIAFVVGDVELSSSLVEGQYPNYDEVIPREHAFSILVDANAFASAVRRAGLMVGVDSSRIDVVFENGMVAMKGSSPEAGESATEFECHYSGKRFHIALNPEYLSEGISICGEKAEIRFLAPERPVVLVRPDSNAFTHVVMPLTLRTTEETPKE